MVDNASSLTAADPHVAFATSWEWRDLTPEDQLVAAHLKRCGMRVTAAQWDDRRVAWQGFDAIVIRSCWDYHLRLAEFEDWLGRLDQLGCRVWNSTRMLRWNSRKTYLEELRARGVDTVATLFLPRGSEADLGELMEHLETDEVVIKPTVGASAHGAWLVTRPQAAEGQARLHTMLRDHELMVQPFLREVQEAGEWSLVFFAGELSHAVNKVPKAGDFRVQQELGGTATARPPDTALVAAGQRTLERLEGLPLYARVDLVEVDGRGVLMELELIEPYLFFDLEPESPERFRRALVERL